MRKLLGMILFLVIASTLLSAFLFIPPCHSGGAIVVESPSEPKIIQRGVGDGVYDPDAECKKKMVTPPSKSADQDISPGITVINVTIDYFTDYKWAVYLYLNATPTQTGWYLLEIHFSFYSPSTLRQHVKNSHFINAQPPTIIGWENIDYTGSPNYIRVDRDEPVEDVMVFTIEFEVTGSGYIEFWIESSAVITDVDGNGIVDMNDIGLVVKNHGNVYDDSDDPLFTYDMDVDFDVDLADIGYVCADFGFVVPP